MHAPFLGLKVNRYPICLQAKFEGKGQGQTRQLDIFELNQTRLVSHWPFQSLILPLVVFD
jgi:hypothetical protein